MQPEITQTRHLPDGTRIEIANMETGDKVHAVSVGQLRFIVTRLERLEDEKSITAQDIREVYAEAKAGGFDVKTLREVIRLRKKEAEQRENEEAMREIYMQALGMKS